LAKTEASNVLVVLTDRKHLFVDGYQINAIAGKEVIRVSRTGLNVISESQLEFVIIVVWLNDGQQ
jgi:hypothetical protein